MNNMYKSLLSIVRNYLVEDNDVFIYDNKDELIELSNKLAISSIVAYVLEKHGQQQYETPLFITYRNYLLQESLKTEINELFSTNSINYMYIKGSSISKYYKDPYLRIGSDIDIVVSNKDYKKTKKLLVNSGYRLEMNVDSECHLISSSGIIIDLHNCFIEISNLLNNYLQTKFNNNHELSIEDTYLLLICHSAKHFNRGVIDLKLFIDLYYLRVRIKDFSNIDNMLENLNLLEYKNTLNRYLDYIIGKTELDDTLNILEEYIIDRSESSIFKNQIIGKIARDGLVNNNKKITLFSYIYSRIFIPKDRMYEQFPNLYKHKMLLPIYYMYRPFYMLYKSRSKLYKIKDELNVVNEIDNDKISSYMILYKELGLYNCK